MLQVYGIKNCNTVKKALDWLKENNKDFIFHDYKKNPISLEKLQEWEKEISWEKLINKKGTTWKKLTPENQASVVDSHSANAALMENNSMIKRPLIESQNGIVLGFDELEYKTKL